MKIRRSKDRGYADHGWLKSSHTFSFADYHDPLNMGFRALRVINEDRVDPKMGFGTHAHQDMEIISYVLDGGLSHKDSMGNGSVIRAGDVQRMSAGTGVRHSEFNASTDEAVHFLQIWIVPDKRGYEPSYEEKHFTEESRRNQLRLIASRDARDGSVRVHQDLNLFASVLEEGAKLSYENLAGRHLWLHVAKGTIDVNGALLEAGDAGSLSEVKSLAVTARKRSEVLFFDLA